MNTNLMLLRTVDALAVTAVFGLAATILAGLFGDGLMRNPALADSMTGAVLAASGLLPAIYVVVFEVLRKPTLREKLTGLLAWPATMILFLLLMAVFLAPMRQLTAFAGALALIGPMGLLAAQLLCLSLVLAGKEEFMGRPVRNHPGTKDYDPEDPWADELPDALQGWNVGAMLTAPVWAFAHRSRRGLVLLIVPVLAMIAPIIIGRRANHWAWQNGMVDDVDTYLAQQKVWLRAGWVVIGLLALAALT